LAKFITINQERGCFVRFLRQAITLLKDEESPRYNHVPAYKFGKYLPIGRLSNKHFFNLVINNPNIGYLEYVATLPCNLSLIACFLTLMFYKVVWQHMQGVAGFSMTTLLPIYQEILE